MNRPIMDVKACLVLLIVCLCRSISGQTDQCSSGVLLQVRPDADVKFSVILTVRKSTDGQTCGGQVSPEAVQNLAVLEWTLNRLNNDNFVDGVTIGFDVYDDCALSRKSMRHGLAVADSPRLGTDACTNGTVCQIGILGTSNSTTTDALLYALTDSALPVFSPFATRPALTDYPDFYRTQLSDEEQIQAVARFLHSLDLTYVAVVTTDDAYGRYAGKRLQDVAKEVGVCVDVIQTVKTGKDIQTQNLNAQKDRARGQTLRVVYFGSQAVARAMFQQLKFEPLTNISWILVEHPEEVDENFGVTLNLANGTLIIRRSSLNVSSVDDYVLDKWRKVINGTTPVNNIEELMKEAGLAELPRFEPASVVPVIDTVFVLAAVLQRQQNYNCGTRQGLCGKFRKEFFISINELVNHSIDYTTYNENVTIRELSAANRIVNFQPNREVRLEGELSFFDMELVDGDALLQIDSYNKVTIFNNNRSAIPASMCNNSCPSCVDIPEVPFAFIDGESLILGVLSVHEMDPLNIFKCGPLRTSQRDVMNVENILHTVEVMKAETGINFGVIIIDDCYSSARTDLVLSQIFSGKLTLIKPESDDIIDVRKIAAVITTTGSTVAITMTMLMRDLKIPVVSSAASSPDLDDRVNFPYFLRTVPSDMEQARAMKDIIISMGWKYVSVLFSDNNYGNKGKEAFVAIAKAASICVADNPEPISDSDTDLGNIFTRLKQHKSDVVIYFGTTTLITKFLKVIDTFNEFVFLGSEDWGNNKDVLRNGGRGALGSITLNNEGSDLSQGTFESYIKTLKPEQNTRNPWFVEYWEDLFKCDLKSSFNNRYLKPCGADVKFDNAQINEFLHDQRIVHASDAVRVIAKGLKVAKDELCKLEDTFPCQKYSKYVDKVVAYIRNQTIDRADKKVRRVFKDDGNGNIGFEINNVQEIDSDGKNILEYKKVGSYDEGVLVLNKRSIDFYRNIRGQCRDAHCEHCQFNSTKPPVTVTTTTHAHPVDHEFTIPDYTVIGILGLLLLVVIIIAIICFCYFKKRNRELETQLKKTAFEVRTSERLHSSGYTSGSGGRYTNGSAGSHNFVNLAASPSGETAHEFQAAQTYFDKRTPNGVVNNGFIGSDMYLHAQHDHEDENQNASSSSSPRGNSSPSKPVTKRYHRDSADYRPTSQTSYGVSTHHSFKKPAEAAVKIQPRTQLNVPPCRPELPPPRDSAHAQRMNEISNNNEYVPVAVPKDKARKMRHHTKRTTSPSSVTRSLSNGSPGSPPYKNYSDFADKFNPSQYLYQPDDAATGNDVHHPEDTGLINLEGSMEKISRV